MALPITPERLGELVLVCARDRLFYDPYSASYLKLDVAGIPEPVNSLFRRTGLTLCDLADIRDQFLRSRGRANYARNWNILALRQFYSASAVGKVYGLSEVAIKQIVRNAESHLLQIWRSVCWDVLRTL